MNYKNKTVYVIEIKFSTSEIKSYVIKEMEKKLASLSLPRGFSIRPILVHVNGVSQGVMESEVFNDIVDFPKFFEI
jgi:uncharacterized protein